MSKTSVEAPECLAVMLNRFVLALNIRAQHQSRRVCWQFLWNSSFESIVFAWSPSHQSKTMSWMSLTAGILSHSCSIVALAVQSRCWSALMSPTVEVCMKVDACVWGYSHSVGYQSWGIDQWSSVQVRLKSYIAGEALRQTSNQSHSEVFEAFHGSVADGWILDQAYQLPHSPCGLLSPQNLKCFQSYQEVLQGSLPQSVLSLGLTTSFHECLV